jgi:RNA polymerase sigma-70 factor (sigma-E family)
VREEQERAFSAFVATRMPALLRYAHLLTGERASAEDVVQHALAATYRHWRRVTPTGADAYVRRSILNTYLSWRRRARFRHEHPVEAVPDRSVAVAHAVACEERDAMWRALAALPPRQRAVLVLRYYEDLSEAEIAQTLGVSTGTVKSQAAKALARLRQYPALRSRDPDPLPAAGPVPAEEPQ